MQFVKINYSESVTLTTGKKFESKRIFFAAEVDVKGDSNIQVAVDKLKIFVKEQLKKELPNPSE